MSTWLDHWDRRYTDRVRLLVDILPVLAQEPRFALKGGTAINLFEHDLPRLSVDIDLAWLPVHDYAEDAKLIAEALGRLADVLRARPLQLQVQTSAGEGAGTVTRLVASRGRARADRDDAGDARHGASGAQNGGAPAGGGRIRLRRGAGAGFRRPLCRQARGGAVAAASARSFRCGLAAGR